MSAAFKKRAKPSLRKREVESDPDAASTPGEPVGDNSGTSTPVGAGETEESPIALVSKLKKRGKTKSKLSFGADEEEGDGEVFQIKKSSLSRKLTLNKQASTNVLTSSYDPLASTTSNSGPTYTAAYLQELKAATPSASLRPRTTEDGSISYDADISPDVTTSHTPPIIDLTGNGESETVIPADSSIAAAKEKRERIRKAAASGGEDYISLSLTKRDDYSGGPHPESRLVREEDELGEGDDEFADFTSAQERIALGKKSRKLEARKRREAMAELIDDAEEQDEETMEWEQEQLRRGGLAADTAEDEQKPVYKPTPIPPPIPIPTLATSVAALSRSLAALTTSHTQHTSSMVSIGDERTQLESREKELREMIARAEEKRSWFATFRDWVENVATFLDEKYPLLEKLEDEHVSLLKERRDMVSQRRSNEGEDDLSLFLGNLRVPQRQQESQSEEIDELGRVVPKANPTAARRERLSARNTRRQRRRASKSGTSSSAQVPRATGTGAPGEEDEGFSTDSSLSPSDAADFATATKKLQGKSKDIFSDVKSKEFLNPKFGLAKRFGEWKEKFGETYTGAWGGLGMLTAWEFWSRMEMLGWDPLEDKKPLDGFGWYTQLHEYSRPKRQGGEAEAEGMETEEPDLGPDGDLVSAMIATAVIPRVCKVLEGGSLDPYSGKHIRRVIDLAEEIEVSVSKDNHKFEMLLKSVYTVFQSAVKLVESTLSSYLALNQPRFDPEAIPARRRYLMRQYKLLHNMVRWRKYAGDKYGLWMLIGGLVSDCIFPVSEAGWEVGGETIMRKVVTLLPVELVPAPVKTRMSLK